MVAPRGEHHHSNPMNCHQTGCDHQSGLIHRNAPRPSLMYDLLDAWCVQAMTRIVLLSLLALPFAAAFLLPGGRTPSPRHLDRSCRRPTALAGSFYGEQRRCAEPTRSHTRIVCRC